MGRGVARLIQRQSEDVFFVDHGSLYVALQRLEDNATHGIEILGRL
jgi:DNA-binding PadR family transcriptional regulator